MHPDFGAVPSSRGIPRGVSVAAAIGIIIIFAIGALVVFNSGFGHQWPAAKTQRVDLGTAIK